MGLFRGSFAENKGGRNPPHLSLCAMRVARLARVKGFGLAPPSNAYRL